MSSTQYELNKHLVHWESATRQFRAEHEAAETAKALYEHKRDIKRTYFMEANGMSAAKAEAAAGADEDIFSLRLEYVRLSALAESTKKHLEWCRSKADAFSTQAADERAANQLHANFPAGA